jgi:short-subunit dehydrogenase involved in D-alanine esterification of teichoic acids
MAPPKTLDFKCAIVTGGGGGLGRAMAEWLLSKGKQVIIVGRTEANLKKAVDEMGPKAKYYVLDTGDVKAIPEFVEKVTKEHPEVDCLINNAGVQKPLDVNKLDLKSADQEININIVGPMHLTSLLLDHFKSKPAAVIMNVSSVLGYYPVSIINPVYNATKAWVHFFTMNLRTQLKDSNIKVVEIVPPTVATNLHRDRSDPDDNKKDKNPNALSVEEFMEFLTNGWQTDADVIGAGMGEGLVERWYGDFGPDYEKVGGKTALAKLHKS